MVVSKPPAPAVAERLLARLGKIAADGTPVVACLLGRILGDDADEPVAVRGTLEGAAIEAARLVGVTLAPAVAEPTAGTAPGGPGARAVHRWDPRRGGQGAARPGRAGGRGDRPRRRPVHRGPTAPDDRSGCARGADRAGRGGPDRRRGVARRRARPRRPRRPGRRGRRCRPGGPDRRRPADGVRRLDLRHGRRSAGLRQPRRARCARPGCCSPDPTPPPPGWRSGSPGAPTPREASGDRRWRAGDQRRAPADRRGRAGAGRDAARLAPAGVLRPRRGARDGRPGRRDDGRGQRAPPSPRCTPCARAWWASARPAR